MSGGPGATVSIPAQPWPASFPAQTSVPPAVADRDGAATIRRGIRRRLRVRVTGWRFPAPGWGGLPYMARTAQPLDVLQEDSDEHGVYRYPLDGRRYEHPVGQARLATGMVAGFRVTSDRRYLDRARANAGRLVETAERRRGALYLPYRYRHRLASGDVMEPVWYSAMAQGLALSALCRVHYLTGESALAEAASGVFASFLNPPRRRRPWTVRVDECGHLWLEEYPDPVGGQPLRVLNGHVFALFGVYDYLWLTGDPRAAVVLDAAITTILDHGPEYRVPGACSRYSLTNPVQKPAYHGTHVWQLARLGGWTGEQRLTRLSQELAEDFRG